jgi:cation diffusion facilitator CzcD-associated flavoprotein CzcO
MHPKNLVELEHALKRQLTMINYPPHAWRPQNPVYDVIIVGAGMAGLAAGFALMKLGITNFYVLDENPPGYEGPWLTFARNKILRSHKELMGPALGVPLLTFEAWYIAQYGEQEWNKLYKIPTPQWMEYLRWFQQMLHLPVANNTRLLAIHPLDNLLRLDLTDQNQLFQLETKKLILATGRSGFGGFSIPAFVEGLPKSLYAHTCERMDFKALRGKQIGIVGAGASAWDAAGEALEEGAERVEILIRRDTIPNSNKVASLSYPGFEHGFYRLSDQERWDLIQIAKQNGAPPPHEALERVKPFSNFQFRHGIQFKSAQEEAGKVVLSTAQGRFRFDFLILGTGFEIDGWKQPELRPLMDQILLWGDRPVAAKEKDSKLCRFPYLDDHFEFQEKHLGSAPFLNHIYCFNFAATLSQGWLSSDIPGISVGASRLAEKIAEDLFKKDWPTYFRLFQTFAKPEFEEKNFPFFDS